MAAECNQKRTVSDGSLSFLMVHKSGQSKAWDFHTLNILNPNMLVGNLSNSVMKMVEVNWKEIFRAMLERPYFNREVIQVNYSNNYRMASNFACGKIYII